MTPQQMKEELRRNYPYRIELHAHTHPASGCSEVSPRELADIYSGLEYDAIVLTNHFMHRGEQMSKAEYMNRYFYDYEQTEYFCQQYGIKVYLGAEIRFTENTNDYLIYGVDRALLEDVYEFLPYGVVNFREKYAMPNSVFIQAHPGRDHIIPIDPAILDGYEVFNMHPGHNGRIGIAALMAKENPDLIVTGGSDFHHPNRKHEGVAAMRAPYLPKDSWDVAKLMKSRNYAMEIGRNHLVL